MEEIVNILHVLEFKIEISTSRGIYYKYENDKDFKYIIYLDTINEHLTIDEENISTTTTTRYNFKEESEALQWLKKRFVKRLRKYKIYNLYKNE